MERWFKDLTSHITPKVGAIEGSVLCIGLGKKWDNAINKDFLRKIRSVQEISIKKWGRGYTHNTLIRTSLVKDWVPSNLKLQAFEDYELTKHVQRRGYKWIRIPSKVYHIKNWKKVAENSIWLGYSLKYVSILSETEKLIYVINGIIYALKCIIDPRLKLSWRSRLYTIYQKLFIFLGYFKSKILQ